MVAAEAEESRNRKGVALANRIRSSGCGPQPWRRHCQTQHSNVGGRFGPRIYDRRQPKDWLSHRIPAGERIGIFVAGSALKVDRSGGSAFVWRNSATSQCVCEYPRLARSNVHDLRGEVRPWAGSRTGPTSS